MHRSIFLGVVLSFSCRDVVPSSGAESVAVLDDARGLLTSADVVVAGVRVGKVESVALADGKARVVFTSTAGDLIAKGACATVGRWSLESRAHLELRPGGTAGADIGPCAVSSIDDVTTASARAVEALAGLVEEARSGKGIVARLLNDEKLAKDLERALARDCAPPPAEPTPAPPPATAAPKGPMPPPTPVPKAPLNPDPAPF
jgi:hypothetical protein